MIHFLHNSCKRRPIAQLWGWDMGCLFEVPSMLFYLSHCSAVFSIVLCWVMYRFGILFFVLTWSSQCVTSACLPYRQTSSIRRSWVGNKIVDHSDVVRASPVGTAPTTSSFSTWKIWTLDRVIFVSIFMVVCCICLFLLTHLRLDKMAATFTNYILKCIFWNENIRILIQVSLKFVPKCPIHNIPTMV